MNRLEQYGIELAMLMRREVEQAGELNRTRGQIEALQQRIMAESPDRLYGPPTGEFAAVQVEQAVPVVAGYGDPADAETEIVALPPGWLDTAVRYVENAPALVGEQGLMPCPGPASCMAGRDRHVHLPPDGRVRGV